MVMKALIIPSEHIGADTLASLTEDHQLGADISLPTRADLLSRVLSNDQLVAIYDLVGRQELERISAVTHGGGNADYEAMARQEGYDLEVLFKAIRQVTGKQRPWIMGFASKFAHSLLAHIDSQ